MVICRDLWTAKIRVYDPTCEEENEISKNEYIIIDFLFLNIFFNIFNTILQEFFN